MNRSDSEEPDTAVPGTLPRRNRVPRWVRRGAALFAGSAVAIALLHGAIRAFHLIPDNVPIAYVQIPGDEGFAPRPRASATSIFGVLCRTDALGLRGPERARSADPRTVRVALVGDSVVWGWGLEERDTIGSWLERLGVERGRPLQAWNLGVQAHNTFNERARYERLAPVLRPQVTVVVALFNDLQDRPTSLRVTPSGSLANPRRRAPFPDRWRPWLDQSVLYWAAMRVYGATERRRADDLSLQHLPALLRQLDRIRLTAIENGSTLVVAVMPGLWPDSQLFGRFSEQAAAYCRERAIPFVDLRSALGKGPDRRLFLPSDSNHPTGEGSRRIAEVLLPVILRSAGASTVRHGEAR